MPQAETRMARLAVLLAAASFVPAAPAAELVHAVEFPYYLCPRTLWERELVWLKTIGVQTVEFSIPWNWHQVQLAEFDFTGRTSPRRDLVAFIRLLRKLDLRAWVRPMPPVRGWLNEGAPAGAADTRTQRAWLRQVEQILAPHTASHGGPIAYVEGRGISIDAPPPPAPITSVSATGAHGLARSREAVAVGRGSLLWTAVEDALYPAGWAPEGWESLRKGAVGLSGDERPPAMALRRTAALLRNWSPLLGGLQPVVMPKPSHGKFSDDITVAQFASHDASAVYITNRGRTSFQEDLRVLEPVMKRAMTIPDVTVPAGESLWLPLHVSIGPRGLCRECSNFSGEEHIVYATAELLAIEFENGILAMEFAAPVPGEVILQLLRRPVGPFIAAGKPTAFDWDDKAMRARLRIPANPKSDYRVRIGIAIEEPETSAFFNDARRLVIGQKNLISTAYSSESVAKRSRLRAPDGFHAAARIKSPLEIEYEVSVPADALHGDWVNLALEADGVRLGRARLQLFRPASIRMTEAIHMHFGADTELMPEPPIAVVEPKAGTNVEFVIRNNSPSIQTYRLEPSGDGLDFFPQKLEISVAGIDERRVSFRAFATDATAGLRPWRLRVGGGATLDLAMRVLLLPRGRTVVWSADLDGDGSSEWIIENQKARAVFSAQDGGRWLELNGKESNVNFLPEHGALAAAGTVEARANGDVLEFSGKSWKRTVKLIDNALSIEQNTPLPADNLVPQRRGNVSLSIERPLPNRAVYTLH
jgi:glycosyl hydrolase family 35